MRLVATEPSARAAESDEDLLTDVAAGDPAERDLAASAFFGRYARAVYGYALRRYGHTLGEVGAEDLVQWTFERAFKSAETYDARGITDPDHLRARTFRWLTRIADGVFNDWLKSTDEATPLQLQHVGAKSTYGALHGELADLGGAAQPPSGDGTSHEDEEPDPLLSSPEGRLLRAALDQLSQREREVLDLTYRYHVDDRPLEIDEADLSALCERWGTTPQNVRTIRRRALKKVREWCACHAPS